MATGSFRPILSFICCVFVIIISESSAQTCVYEKGNFTINSTYHKNLNTLLSSFPSYKHINYGFYNISYGENPDKVYAIGLCRGDQTQDQCLSCLNTSRVSLTQNCPNQKEAITWPGECMLRYSNRSIFGVLETQPELWFVFLRNVTGSVDRFNEALHNLMGNLMNEAALGDSRRKYAAGNASAPDFQTIYAYVQCTPDLSSNLCTRCLSEAISAIPDCCNGRAGGNVVKPSCRIRFDPYLYYGPTVKIDPDAPPPLLQQPPSSPSGMSNTSRTIIAITVPVASVVLLLSLICICRRVRNATTKRFESIREDDDKDEITVAESLQLNFDTIQVATNDFSDSNKLGQGGFGAVYKGQLSNGQVIAVKRLSTESCQGEMEFKNEVLLVAKLQHRNLVRLLGFCLKGRERLLVYEFVPNKSLDYFIFNPTKKAQLDWERRYQIIRGIARGMVYLHEDSRLRIIHRDLKASNILLDEEMNPKISDFGMARLVVVDQTQGNTSRIVGTYGYMAPEYAAFGQFSTKSDVFSFGVLVLEIISGQKISGVGHGEHVENLLSFVWRNWRDGTATKIVDPTLNGSQNEIMRCIHVGLLCVQENADARPTMASILLMLNSYSLSLPRPLEPAFFVDSRTRSLPDIQSSEYNSRETRTSESTNKSTQESVNEASITEPYPR